MKPITVSRRSKLLNQLLQAASQKNVILQSADGTQFLLARIDAEEAEPHAEAREFIVGASEDFDQEVAATRQNTAFMAFLDERASQAKSGEHSSLEQIRRRLGD